MQGDAATPSLWWDGTLFDRILLDAPCSATGVIRRHSDIKLLRTEEEIVTITKIQHTLLNALWPLLAKDGILVYATCSVMSVENEQQISRFVAKKIKTVMFLIISKCGDERLLMADKSCPEITKWMAFFMQCW